MLLLLVNKYKPILEKTEMWYVLVNKGRIHCQLSKNPSLSTHSISCVCVCVYTHTCKYKSKHTSACGGQRTTLGIIPQESATLFSETRSLIGLVLAR